MLWMLTAQSFSLSALCQLNMDRAKACYNRHVLHMQINTHPNKILPNTKNVCISQSEQKVCTQLLQETMDWPPTAWNIKCPVSTVLLIRLEYWVCNHCRPLISPKGVRILTLTHSQILVATAMHSSMWKTHESESSVAHVFGHTPIFRCPAGCKADAMMGAVRTGSPTVLY